MPKMFNKLVDYNHKYNVFKGTITKTRKAKKKIKSSKKVIKEK